MTVKKRIELRERTHLKIACAAAIAAGLAKNKEEAMTRMRTIIQAGADRLKERWLIERGGGVKGWHYFLRTYGFEEKLVVQRIRK